MKAPKERALLMWIVYALLAALAGATLVTLTKVGLKNVDHSLALAVQSVLILVIAWGAVAVRGQFSEIGNIDRKAWICLLLAGVVTSASYLLLFQALKLGEVSRVAPLVHTLPEIEFHASQLKLGEVSRVAPLDRLSLVFAIALGVVFLKEEVNAKVIIGGALMAAGALLIAVAGK
jgi:transporter family protein